MIIQKPTRRPPGAPMGTGYFAALATYPLLSAEAERALAVRARAGDREAREAMICANLRLVVKVAKGYAGRGVAFADLVQGGNIGLMRAVELFDPARGYRFSTYACRWIGQSISREVANTAETIRVPCWARDLHTRAGKPGGAAGLTAEERAALARVETARSVLPIASVVREPVDPGADAEEEVEAVRERAERVRRAVARLPSDERECVRLRFGLDGGEARLWRDVGKTLGMGQERMRDVSERALAKLRNLLEEAS